MKIGRLQKTIIIPEDISVKVDKSKVHIKGSLGEMERDFTHSGIQIEHVNNELLLSSYFPRRKDKSAIRSIEAHIKNMIEGTTYGYKYSMKIVFSHFPIRVNPEMKKQQVKIENLYGGRKPRFAKILPEVLAKRKVVKREIQKLYNYGKISLIDRDYFPNFDKKTFGFSKLKSLV